MPKQNLSFRRDLLGVDYPVMTIKITSEKVLAYCRLLGDENSLYTDLKEVEEVLVPATYLSSYVSAKRYPDIELDFPGVMVKGGQSIEMLKRVQAGEELDLKVHLKDVFTKTGRSGTMAFAVWKTTFSQKDGEVVAIAQDHYVYYPKKPSKT
jgi:acyl dehydratase